MTINIEDLATKYKTTAADVQLKVDNYRAKVKATLEDMYTDPEVLNAEVDSIVISNVSSLFTLSGLEYAEDQFAQAKCKKIYGIVLGVSPVEDRNDFDKRAAKKIYFDAVKEGATAEQKQALTDAINSKVLELRVSEKTGNKYPVALYSKRTVEDEDGNEIPNPDFGKEIPYEPKVVVPMIVTGVNDDNKEEFKMGNMRWDSELKHPPKNGMKSIVYGNYNPKSVTIYKDAYKDSGVYDKAFETAMRVLPSVTYTTKVNGQKVDKTYWTDLKDVKAMPSYTVWCGTGKIQSATVNDGKLAIRIGNSDVVEGIKLSTKYGPVVASGKELAKGDDVIVFGRKKQFKNDEGNLIQYHELWGFVRQANSAHDKAVQRLKEKGLL